MAEGRRGLKPTTSAHATPLTADGGAPPEGEHRGTTAALAAFVGVRAALLSLLMLASLAAPAQAQFLFSRPKPVEPPPGLPPTAAEAWPFPPPDPAAWWTEKRPTPPEAADPLGGRRLPHGRRLPTVDNGVDPATYRLWGLMPLQWQVLHGDEMILEVWVRPSRSVRQSVVRITVRDDGRAFVQGRAGLACCDAGIGRRVGFDAELPAGSAERFQALRNDPMWSAPREVVEKGEAAASAVCVSGVDYDVTLLTASGARALHRACDPAAVGQIADALEPALRAALGHDPRFDVTFRDGVDFSAERKAYQDLVASGGRLVANPLARRPPPGAEPAPQPEAP
jgi:hypothetical protein